MFFFVLEETVVVDRLIVLTICRAGFPISRGWTNKSWGVGGCAKSFVSWLAQCMMMRNRYFVQSQAQPVEKSGGSELSLLFSTKFACMKQTDSNYPADYNET